MTSSVRAVCRLLVEDPNGWATTTGDTRYFDYNFRWDHRAGLSIGRTESGTIYLNGERLGRWAAFWVRRALAKRQERLVDRYLALPKAVDDADVEAWAEVRRLVG